MTRTEFLEQYVLARIPTKWEMKHVSLHIVDEADDFYDRIHDVKKFDSDPDGHPQAHDWQNPVVGMYDTTYSCTRCGALHTESVDDPDSLLPTLGCNPR